jgi:hypothetical protein
MKKMMQVAACGLFLVVVSAVAAAPPIPTNFDPIVFEQRFNKADKGNKGKLTRAEAYAEFPRMPEFFDEIDTNKDGFITLAEVRRAIDKRVNAAMDASKASKRYGSGNPGESASGEISPDNAETTQFSSEAAERSYRRNQQYELLARSNALPPNISGPFPNTRTNPIFQRSF